MLLQTLLAVGLIAGHEQSPCDTTPAVVALDRQTVLEVLSGDATSLGHWGLERVTDPEEVVLVQDSAVCTVALGHFLEFRNDSSLQNVVVFAVGPRRAILGGGVLKRWLLFLDSQWNYLVGIPL